MTKNYNHTTRILLVGGGSGGSVSPLLAVANAVKSLQAEAEFLFIGSKSGPEKQMAESAGLPFAFINSGKLRRYWSLKNLVLPLELFKGFIDAYKIIKKFRPHAVFGCGSFVQVPVMWAAWFLKVPVIIHQQDLSVTLSNKLCEWCASKITVSFEKSVKDFGSNFGLFYKKAENKILLTGNPFREEILKESKEDALKFFGLMDNMPTLLVLGGGTGSEFINKLVIESLPVLTKFVQVVHIAGNKKSLADKRDNYHGFEFTNEIGKAYAAADLVLSRAGLSTITELSATKKVSVIVPMPNSHQELNAWLLAQSGSALVVEQKFLNSVVLVRLLRKVLFDYTLQKNLAKNIFELMPKNASEKIAKIIFKEIRI